MYTANITLVGITPILLNPATPDLLVDIDCWDPDKRPKPLTHEEQLQKIVDFYMSTYGSLGLTRNYIVGNLVNAYRKSKPKPVSNITFCDKRSLLWSCITLDAPEFLPFVPCGEPVVDVQQGTSPLNGETVAVARCRLDEWGLQFSMSVLDDELIPPRRLGKVFEIGGTFFGIGDFRPQKGGHFGQYRTEITITGLIKSPALIG